MPGADARLDAIDSSVRAAIEHARTHDVPTIYLPRIGAGIGGLDWSDVHATLDAVADGDRGRRARRRHEAVTQNDREDDEQTR